MDIAFSSTDSLYLNVQDILAAQTISCRILFRNPEVGDTRFRNKIERFTEQWKNIESINPHFSVQMKYCSNTSFRLIILDDKEVYFGFYKYENGRLRGHNVPMIHVTKGTGLGDHLLFIARNRFEALWDTSLDVISERHHKV